MARNRVLAIENDGEYIDAQIVQEDGQVVVASYRRCIWIKPPADVGEDLMRRASLPPQTVARTK